MRIDAHQHFWRYTPDQYPWIGPAMDVLRRDFLPTELASLQEPLNFHGSIAVQARQNEEETRWLLDLGDAHAHVLGVVGWVDLRAPNVDDSLARFAAHPRFVGVRHVVQDEPDDQFLLGKEFMRGLARLSRHDLTYDLLIYPRQLAAAVELVRRMPGQRFVLDHAAKPPIRERSLQPWAGQLQELASLSNVWCKVSGLVTEANWDAWTGSDLHPYLEVIFDAFGPDRLMVGSDWPVCLLAGDYSRVMNVASDYMRRRAPQSLDAFLGGTAAAFYLKPSKLNAP